MRKKGIAFWVMLILLTFGNMISGVSFGTDFSALPAEGPAPAEPIPHFPDRQSAFIWRNWNLTPVENIAKILETTPENVTVIAESLGLPPSQPPTWSQDQIYITLLRRNWHLLSFEQMLNFLNFTPEQLAFKLREDDFLWHKLGSTKPLCEPLVYETPTAEKMAAYQKIGKEIRAVMGDDLNLPESPRFSFIDELKSLDSPAEPEKNNDASKQQNRFSLRYVYSYFALFGDPLLDEKAEIYPDGLLEKLSRAGVNGIWLHVVLRDLTPGGELFPEFGKDCEIRLANLRTLVNRAKKYGIDVYLYMNEPRAMPKSFFENRPEMRGVAEGDYCALCASCPEVRKWLSDSLAYLFQEVPGLGGIFTISGSENLTTCASHFRQQDCPRCSQHEYVDLIADLNAAMEEGVHRSAPAAKVIVWDWGWKGHGLTPDIIAKLPKNVWFMSVSEWALPINRGGVDTTVGEYSISSVGPGPRATEQWKAARDAGLNTVAKVQLNTTWETASVPYLPVMDLVAEHVHRLAGSGVNGLMMSWSLGGYPSMNLTLPQAFDMEPLPSVDDVLHKTAVQMYGDNGAPLARKGWSRLSTAFLEYPYSGATVYNAPVQVGPANLFRLTPSIFHATMVGIPYDDLTAWRGPYPADIFAAQFDKMGHGFLEGAELLKQAAEYAVPGYRKEAVQSATYAETAGVIYLSVANQVRFIMLRDELLAMKNSPDSSREAQKEIRQKMQQILRDEIELAKSMYRLTKLDARIGFESTNHYWFIPDDLLEKVISCQQIIRELD